ncbi:MAG: ATP-binding cassette domain-containing protein, partial [Oleiphilaceae bacterium]|nr:ATP-binding cassette domain-containing protein [Oleiphilaceae bacterium]
LSEGREFIDINGQQKHVLGYLQEFLFSPARARSPVSVFSGGERARLLLAKLFSKPANILVLDEPTNDLDVETLELLESQLVLFKGTVIVISHDREFLDNVVTDTLFLDGTGAVHNFVGGYTDWRRQGGTFPSEHKAERPASKKESRPPASKAPEKAAPTPKAPKRSYKVKLELEQLPAKIEQLERDAESLRKQISDPDFYIKPASEVTAVLDRLAETEATLEKTMERWMELEEQGNE